MNSVVTIKPLQHELTLRQKEIITILGAEGEMSLKDINERLENPPAERTLGEDLTTLKKMGIINSLGQTRSTKWVLIRKA